MYLPETTPPLSLLLYGENEEGEKETRKSGLYPRVNRRRNIRSTFSAAREERRKEVRTSSLPSRNVSVRCYPHTFTTPPPIWGCSHRFSHTPLTGFAKPDKGPPSKKRDSNGAAPAQGFLGDLPFHQNTGVTPSIYLLCRERKFL